MFDPNLPSKIAARYLQASGYFSIGDFVLYGKYKNKRGKVVSFGKDKWGNPTIEIEPVPKGRKQNKILGLYKIWRADVKEKALAEKDKMDNLTPRVLNAYHRKQALDIGRTWDNENWRVHRYADSIKVTDLTNAGKRGKKVQILSVVAKRFRGESMAGMESLAMELIMHAKRGASYARMKQVAEEAAEAGIADFYEESERGVDVAPGNFGPISIHGKNVTIEVGWKDFSVRDKVDQNNLPTCIPAIKGGLKAIPVFYRWVDENRAALENMTFREVTKAMGQLGIPYHEYCAMD